MDVARPIGADTIKDSRGVAIADLNLDGRLDLIINNNNSTPTIYINHMTTVGNWVEFKLVGRLSNRDAIGAQVRLHIQGQTLTRQVEAGAGYASQAMLPVHFGLGDVSAIDRVTIRWPNGLRQTISGQQIELNRRHRLVEGGSNFALSSTR